MATSSKINSGVQLEKVKFKWTIKKFREQKGALKSKIFSGPQNRTKWSLLLYPEDFSEESRGWVSLFLQLNDSISPVDATCRLSIVNSATCKENFAVDFTESFAKNGMRTWGYRKFATREECMRLLANDALSIECTVTLIEQKLVVEIDDKGLLSNQEQLFLDGDYNDCTLICGDAKVSACKFLLASQSPVFRKMFVGESEEAKTGLVKIDDIRAEVMKELTRFTVCGKVDKLQLMEELLVAADKYEVDALKNICAMKMIETLTKENICRRLAISDRHNVDCVKKAAIGFLKSKRIDVKELPEFKYLIVPEHQDMIVEIFSTIYALSV